MKRVLSILLAMVMTVGCCYFSPTKKEEVVEKEKPQIVETKVHYLTDEQLSKLYTVRQDVRRTDSTCVELNQSDVWLLMQVARAEGGESFEGQLWSMGVIINRINSNDFPNSVYEVVSQDNPTQFEVFKTGSYKTADINVNTHLALAEIEKGLNPTQNAIWFESSSNSDNSWHKSKDFVAEIQGQRYYR